MKWLCLFSCFTCLLFAETNLPSSKPLRAKYSALAPDDAAKNFAFYELYPQTHEGKLALKRALSLLNITTTPEGTLFAPLSVDLLIEAVNRSAERQNLLPEKTIVWIENSCTTLKNRQLKGYNLWNKQEIRKLPSTEIDLGRALFVEQYTDRKIIRNYEALLDLMAVQILSRLPKNASAEEMIYQINKFIFYEKGFRFPPQSVFTKEIDTYTLLPSVIDSKKGVCLGVSILYLCIAQRLGLSLEAITPPGHIYVRYHNPEKPIVNIETTARGVHIPCEHYLNIATRTLKKRSIKEVVGLSFINEASVRWIKEDYKEAVSCYEKATNYLPDDPLLEELLAYNYLFVGEEKKGKQLLQKIQQNTAVPAVGNNTIAADYLAGKVSTAALRIFFMHTEQERQSIMEKQQQLTKILQTHPQFRAALFQLAMSYLQLGREKKALQTLESYQQISPNETLANYYLAVIYYNRYDYKRSWECLEQVKCSFEGSIPKMLQDFEDTLQEFCPKPKYLAKGLVP